MSLANPDQISYIENLVHGMIRGPFEIKVLVYGSNLFVVADDAFLYQADVSDKLTPDIMFGYKTRTDYGKKPLEDYEVDFIINKYRSIVSQCKPDNHIFENDALRDDPVYEEMTHLKVSDGARFYFMNAKGCTPFMPVFSGLPILNNKDTAGVDLYDVGDHHIIVYMKVYKKKFNMTYNLYYRILDVNRPMRRF